MEYKFKINNFEGPLDLLLHLIKEAKMEIMDIEIVELTNQYLKYIEQMNNLNLTIASEYLVMASELIELKSKMLLPRKEEEIEDDFEEQKQDLVNRLLEYQKYKDMTKEFKVLEEKRKDVFTKLPSNLNEYKTSEVKINDDISLNDLLLAFQKVLERQKLSGPINTKITTKELSVEERVEGIKKILSIRKKLEFTELFEEFSKPYVVVTFLSILEMAKRKEIKITQENNFDKIYCEVA